MMTLTDVVNPDLETQAGQLRGAFDNARPFRHLCIDGFLTRFAADRALAMIHYACAAVLRQFGAPESGARDLALQIWAYSHGVAQLSLSGHLDGNGADPSSIMTAGVSNIVEMAVRRAVAR